MLTRRAALPLCVLAGLSLLLNRGGRELPALTAVHAQVDSSRSVQRPPTQPSTLAVTGTPAARELFRQHCVKCHGAEGTGSPMRERLPGIPDFTDASWQVQRSDEKLLASILNGKGKEMPSWRGKLSDDQVRSLVAYVRAFAPTTRTSGREPQQKPPAAQFEERYRRLQEQLDELKRQHHELSKVPSGGASSKPSESPQQEVPRPSAPAAAGTPAAPELFRQHCVKCHGADGSGSPARGERPEIPDFTDASWQARRSEAQLLASILEGKGKEMPPWRGKISDEQARGLVAYVRAFAPTKGKSGPEEQQGPAPAESAEAKPPTGFFEKLIRWLGKFHPPAVHFPIALLTAAAVAELLRLATGQPAFDAVARCCVWFGALIAVVAGVLGWFVGSFRLTNASWIMVTHCWLGTSTVAWAGLVLVLSEVSRRPDRCRTWMWFRVTLLVGAVLVLVTGFFGGAVVFGLDHYAWPP